MKNTSRVRHNGGKNTLPEQVQTKPRSDLSRTVMEAADALSVMEFTSQAARALLMMDAWMIQHTAKNHAGLEALEAPGFLPGVRELARTVAMDFEITFAQFGTEMRSTMEQINGDRCRPMLTSRGGFTFESATDALRNTVEMFGIVLSENSRPENQTAHCAAFSVSQKLKDAFNTLWTARTKLNEAFNSVASQPGVAA